MKATLLLLLTLSLPLLFTACGGGGGSSETYEVSVYSLAPVHRAIVKDAKGQLAIASSETPNVYKFSKAITWPVTATSDGVESYIDIDFDGRRTASDIPFIKPLYSNSPAVSEVTTLLLDAANFNPNTLDFNRTQHEKNVDAVALHYTISQTHIRNATPMTASDKRFAMLSDAIFWVRHESDYNASNLSKIDPYFNLFENFFNEHLESKNANDAAMYHESLTALKLIDTKKVEYVQSNNTPIIPSYLNRDYNESIVHLPHSSFLSSPYNELGNLAYWDIALDTNHSLAYVAAGNDGLDVVDISTPSERVDNLEQNSSGFGTTVKYFDRNDSRCIFVASQANEVLFYSWDMNADIPALVPQGGFNSYIPGAKAYDIEYLSTNAQNIERLLIADGLGGLKVLDAKAFTCKSSLDLNSTHLIGTTKIGLDTHGVTASSNRKIIYIADGISGVKSVDISGANPLLVDTIALQVGKRAYDIHLAPNTSELYVSPEKGIEIVSSEDTGVLEYRGNYLTEGSRANTLGETLKVDRSKNAKALFVADVTGGIKILDVSDSSYPRLCGVAYFGVGEIAQRSAVRDIKLYEMANGAKKLYLANDANGLIVIEDVKDMLFEHCKELLD
jgi:hypothetical protein